MTKQLDFYPNDFPVMNFHIAYFKYTNIGLSPEDSWGDILDGPVREPENVIEAIIRVIDRPHRNNFYSHYLSENYLQVFYLTDDNIVKNVTQSIIDSVIKTLEDRKVI